jgi:pimeloyl-ACP methyl ester carboxylesterase
VLVLLLHAAVAAMTQGAVIARNIGITAPGCKAVHVNMPIGRPPQGEDAASNMTEKEQAAATAAAVFQATETGYQSIQGTKPQTLGYGLHDSPVGLLAWLTEKFWAWSDLGEDDAADGADGLLAAYSMDELLTNISLYWFSGCITSSTRLYYETLGPLATGEGRSNFAKPVTVPCGIALFAKEPFAGRIQAWVEAAGYNVRRWTDFPQGGHFAAREQPAALVADMRAFVFSDLAVDERPATPPASGGAAATASSKL